MNIFGNTNSKNIQGTRECICLRYEGTNIRIRGYTYPEYEGTVRGYEGISGVQQCICSVYEWSTRVYMEGGTAQGKRERRGGGVYSIRAMKKSTR